MSEDHGADQQRDHPEEEGADPVLLLAHAQDFLSVNGSETGPQSSEPASSGTARDAFPVHDCPMISCDQVTLPPATLRSVTGPSGIGISVASPVVSFHAVSWTNT